MSNISLQTNTDEINSSFTQRFDTAPSSLIFLFEYPDKSYILLYPSKCFILYPLSILPILETRETTNILNHNREDEWAVIVPLGKYFLKHLKKTKTVIIGKLLTIIIRQWGQNYPVINLEIKPILVGGIRRSLLEKVAVERELTTEFGREFYESITRFAKKIYHCRVSRVSDCSNCVLC